MILIDTDVLIDASRGVWAAMETLRDLHEVEELAISAVSQMELIVGCRSKWELSAIDELCSWFRVIHIDERMSNHAIGLLTRYRLSHGLALPDALIAASAIFRALPLLSKNQKHFRFIPELMLLSYPN
ncbi:MAG TPA: type II toxin-antitoxin system VapC family toxin [Thermoanaerobaculia bacterium]|nr:type II toxin-antitoxin system VapC family toxin [Thermoanaerobaculia bacterium]